MSVDRVTSEWITRVRSRVSDLKDDLARMDGPDLYAFGKLQGRIRGLTESLNILEDLIEEEDKD